jgi:tetratricopeptide (TPR) repeat protein
VENAKADLQAAIDRNPREVANYLALDTLYEKEGNWERARKVCEKAHEVDPDSSLVANNLAYLYLEHGGDVNVALSLAQTVRQKMPDSPQTADTLGWAYYKLGLAESAVLQLKECAQKDPNNPTYQYHLGMAYMAARHFDLAGGSLQKALRDNPNFPDAASARAALAKISKGP